MTERHLNNMLRRLFNFEDKHISSLSCAEKREIIAIFIEYTNFTPEEMISYVKIRDSLKHQDNH